MQITRITLRQVDFPYKTPLITSHFRVDRSHAIIVELALDDHVTGWGESPLLHGPYYNEECTTTGWIVMTDYLVPLLLGAQIAHPRDIAPLLTPIIGNAISKAGLEMAAWDAYAQVQGQSLSAALGGTHTNVPIGVSLGIAPTIAALLDRIARYVDAGYGRVKLKIRPGWDIEVVRAVREHYPDLPLQVDANTAYTLADIAHLRQLDAFDLLLIEQPFAHDDLLDHATLQAQMTTPVCLDESITSPEKTRKAIALDAARVINIKPARVGGLHAAVQIHDLARAAGIAVWCGGMMETGVGRATNVALASLPGFTLAGDISPSEHYFDRDIVTDPFRLQADSCLMVPQTPGSGMMVDTDYLNQVTVRHADYRVS